MKHTPMRASPWVLGVSASHNGAACLLHGDDIVVAVQEERLSRTKRQRIRSDDREPSRAARHCLGYANLRFSDIDAVVMCDFAGVPIRRPLWVENSFFELSHHLGHAYAAFATSGFSDAMVLVVDGQGTPLQYLEESERESLNHSRVAELNESIRSETVSVFRAEGTTVSLVEKHTGAWLSGGAALDDSWSRMPAFGSVGGMFSAASVQIFGNSMEAGKVMGLAPYGRPEIPTEQFFTIDNDGSFNFTCSVRDMYPEVRNWPDAQAENTRLAASVQHALEVALEHYYRRIAASGATHLCYAGGVALNSIANEKVLFDGRMEDVYIMPAAEDSGPAIGAAFYGLWKLTKSHKPRRINRDDMGRTYSAAWIESAFRHTPAIVEIETDNSLRTVVDALCEAKIVGWFRGGSEFGPRSLGHRSILCDARRVDGKDLLNQSVKHRESFRPFAPAVLRDRVEEWFEINEKYPDCPHMLRICRFKDDKREIVPAVVHVDGTGRLQTVTESDNGLFYRLVKLFGERTGVPIVLNTSFNVAGEPIVETPEDALWCLLYTGIDMVFIEGRVFTTREGYTSVLDLTPCVNALTVSVTFPRCRAGSFELPDEEATYKITAENRWGPTEHYTTALGIAVLELVEPGKTGWDLVDELAELVGKRLGENRSALKKLVRTQFGAWFRHGIATFLSPSEVTFQSS